MFDYIILKPAQKYLERLRVEEQVRIIRALDGLITGTENLDIKPLKGREESRLRVGKYRILFIEDTVNQQNYLRLSASICVQLLLLVAHLNRNDYKENGYSSTGIFLERTHKLGNNEPQRSRGERPFAPTFPITKLRLLRRFLLRY